MPTDQTEVSPSTSSDASNADDANNLHPATSMDSNDITDSLQGPEDEHPPLSPAGDDWSNHLATVEYEPEKALDTRVSTISYVTISYQGEEIIETQTAAHFKVQESLRYFHHLRAHLRASVNILHKHTPETFSQPALIPTSPDFSYDTDSLATDQILFAHHHAAVSETLAALDRSLSEESFGLPDAAHFRHTRNEFCHSILTPGGEFFWTYAVNGVKKWHERLQRQVEVTTGFLEEALADETVWRVEEEEKEGDKKPMTWYELPGTGEVRDGVGAVLGEGRHDEQVQEEEDEDEEVLLTEQQEFGNVGVRRRWSTSHVISMEQGWIEYPRITFPYEDEDESGDYLGR